MTVEAATTIAQLNPAWPLFDDQIVEGDDHIRLLKQVMQNDALSRSLGTAQTVVGPTSFNGLLTAKAGTRHESAAPFIDFRETDQALPLGLYRLSLSGNIFSLLRNTAVAGDFATSTSIWSYTPADGYLNFPTAKFSGVPRIESAQPRLELRESDVALPGGLFRSMASAGNFHLQVNTALAGDFATAVDILKFTASTGRLSFGVPVDLTVSGYLPLTGGTLTGNLTLESAAPELRLAETDQVDPVGRYRWAGVGGALQLQKALTAAWATSEVLSEYDPATGRFIFNKTATFTSASRYEMTTPRINFIETDAVSPLGQYSIRGASSGDFLFSTFDGPNLTTEFDIWRYSGSLRNLTYYVPIVAPGLTSSASTNAINGNAPSLQFNEIDQVDPAGRYRFLVSSNAFQLQRALTPAWASAETIWSYNFGTADLFAITKPTEFQNVVTVTGANRMSVAYNAYFATDGGNLIVGSTTASGSSLIPSVNLNGGVGNGGIAVRRAGTANQTHVSFANNVAVTPTTVGAINTSGSATTYATSSDETLKDIGGDYDPQDAIAVIRADPVLAWNWKADGTPGVGWVAQRSIEVSPDLASHIPPVVGAKDDEPLQEEWWGIDYGKRTPYLWAALAGALDRLDTIEARLAAYEGTPA